MRRDFRDEPPREDEHQLMREAMKRLGVSDGYFGSTDRFVHIAMEALLNFHGNFKVSGNEWNNEGTEVITGYVVLVPELGPEQAMRACSGDTLQEALATAILTEDVIEL